MGVVDYLGNLLTFAINGRVAVYGKTSQFLIDFSAALCPVLDSCPISDKLFEISSTDFRPIPTSSRSSPSRSSCSPSLCTKPIWSTPLGDLDQVIRLFEGNFLVPSLKLLRNRRFPIDYRAHAHKETPQSPHKCGFTRGVVDRVEGQEYQTPCNR